VHLVRPTWSIRNTASFPVQMQFDREMMNVTGKGHPRERQLTEIMINDSMAGKFVRAARFQ
jgi:hypothetical protein